MKKSSTSQPTEPVTPANHDEQAPTYKIPPTRLVAVEHPMIVKDIEKAVKTFGRNPDYRTLMNANNPQISFPLWLRHDNPTARPLTSHNAACHHVVLKVTVPKRTGRKRKRGSDDPFEGEISQQLDNSSNGDAGNGDPRNGNKSIGPVEEIASTARRDAPRVLRRKLADNVGKYAVEVAGTIKNVHRYRGLADFQYSLGESQFMRDVVSKLLPGEVSKMREFSLRSGLDQGKNIPMIPPPTFTTQSLPAIYQYQQNPYTKKLDDIPSDMSDAASDAEFGRVINITSNVRIVGVLIKWNQPTPLAPNKPPDLYDDDSVKIMAELNRLFDERPIWTRRALLNCINPIFAKKYLRVKYYIQFAAYQFRGGPWRDALVKYGVDPRSDPKYRIYQTMIFKLTKLRIGSVGRTWQSVRRNEMGASVNFVTYGKQAKEGLGRQTHQFDGRSFATDAKVWQVCDITDPVLVDLFTRARPTPVCEPEINGWFQPAMWGGAKSIMRTKLIAIRFNKTHIQEMDWEQSIQDCLRDSGDWSHSVGFRVPQLKLTLQEREQITGRRIRPGVANPRDRTFDRKKSYRRVRGAPVDPSDQQAEDEEAAAGRKSVSFAEPAADDEVDTGLRAADEAGNHSRQARFEPIETDRENEEEDEDGEGNSQQALFEMLEEEDEEFGDDDDSDDDVADDQDDTDSDDEEEPDEATGTNSRGAMHMAMSLPLGGAGNGAESGGEDELDEDGSDEDNGYGGIEDEVMDEEDHYDLGIPDDDIQDDEDEDGDTYDH